MAQLVTGRRAVGTWRTRRDQPLTIGSAKVATPNTGGLIDASLVTDARRTSKRTAKLRAEARRAKKRNERNRRKKQAAKVRKIRQSA